MSLMTSKVPRALETKTKLFGFELADVLIIFIYLSVTNLIFGGTGLKFPIVWGGTAVLAGCLYFLKKGRPDNYLQHLGEFYSSPGIYYAGANDLEYRPYISSYLVRNHE